MEEKENSLILMLSFIAGIISSMKNVGKVNIILLMILIIILTKKCELLKITNKKFAFTGLLILTMFLFGWIRGYIFEVNYNNTIKADLYYENRAVVKKIMKKDLYTIKLNESPNCLVVLRSKQKLIPGMQISLTCLLEVPKDSLNRGGFSYKEYLKYRNIEFITNSEEIRYLKQIKNIDYYLYKYQIKYLNQLRKYLGNRIRFIDSIFLGNSKSMNENEINTWRNMGILHLQAVSGSQIGATLDILMFIFILTPKKGLTKYVLFTIPLLTYGLMTNSPSVWRAILYIIVIKILQINNRNKLDMLALMFTMIILLVINPGMLYQISFQLSYVITIGLLLFKDNILRINNKFHKIIYVGFLSIIFAWPLLIQYFQEVSLFGIIFTPLFAPFIQLIIFISCILMFLPFAIVFLKPLVFFLNILLIILEGITTFSSKIDFLIVRGKPWGFLIISIFYIYLVFWNNKKFKLKYKHLFPLIFASLIIWNNFSNFIDNENICVTFINVGQGDCILIECKDTRKVILIDGGAKNNFIDMGEKELLPYLKRKGINKIDYLISTHSDNDHRGGLESVLKYCEVSEILIPYNNNDEYLDWISKYNGKVKEINQGYKIILGDTIIDILNPLKIKKDLDSNSKSIVLSLNYYNSNILLTADCDLDVLERLIIDDYSFDIVKAPHHGSKYSYKKNIYSQLKVKSVIFSVGKNLYGHPSKEIINDLNIANIDYYRTDYDKDIVIKLKRNEIDINDKKYLE